MKKLLIPTLLLLSLPLAALEIRVQPGEVVYAYEVDPARGLYTVLLQNVAVIQKDGGPVTLDSLEIQAVNGGQVVQTVVVPAADLEKSAQRLSAMEAQGLLKLYDFHFQTSRYLNGLKIAANRTLSPGSALVVFGKPLLLSGLPSDGLAILAHGKDADGKPAEARTTLRVENHKSPNEYLFPLAGTWYVGAGPNLESPHRWAANEEFAFDLAALGGDGLTHKGDGSHLTDYYAYGRDVLAVADGEVVEVVSDALEANDRLKQPGESEEDFEKRTYLEQAKLLAQSYKAPLGNYVILRHAGGEFSHYAHLKQGSVRVKAGDTVKRGQPIAQLGQTGNTTEPHLHFQLTDGPDPLYSRGVPILFKNAVSSVGFSGSYLQTGWIVTAK
ncbi:MAG TPA: M23 family metallopeptidase [Thermoanaerobaculia bacterium]|jgi:murein DD-endopeptidase MepM/ murein hydrolase activator NlpD